MADIKLTKKDQEQIARIKQGLKCSYEEAFEIYKCDKAIDKGEHMDFDLTKDQEKEVRKMIKHETMTGTKKKPPNYTIKPKEKKVNEPKKAFIEDLVAWLGECDTYENIEVVNAERQVKFTIGEDTFELTLVQKRRPKS